MTLTGEEVTTDVSLGPAALVAVTLAGAALPRHGGVPPLPLDLAGLVLLERLASGAPGPASEVAAAVAADVGADAGDLLEVVRVLEDLGILQAGRPTAVTGPAPEAGATPADVPRDEPLVLTPSILFQATPAGFVHHDFDGRPDAVVGALELHAVSQFRLPSKRNEALRAHRQGAGRSALNERGFDAVVSRLLAAGVIDVFDPSNPMHAGHNQNAEHLRQAIRRKHQVVANLEADVVAHEEAERAREARTGVTRTRVVPVGAVETHWSLPPVALGFLVAYAKVHDGGALDERYQFHPRWVTDADQLAEAARQPGIFLFSNYIWNHAENLLLSNLVKQGHPANITIHGGPNTPKYQGDCERYFAEHAHVDITVRGEGEATFAEILTRLPALEEGPVDLAVLAGVEGLSYRGADGAAVHTPDRARIVDLDSIPSPYLTGLFDSFGDGLAEAMIIETNRGCPYGCTFCDWGSATASRIRKFSLDRIMAELDWCAENRIHTVSVADANYGIFERDVEIATRVAELKSSHGFPQLFATNYAKNTVKHLRPIIEVLAEAGIITEGKVSLQSMNEETLLTIKRSNIKLERYDDLAIEFRKSQLPLTVDLMMGLPGATLDSFRSDLQECIDREMPAIVHTTTLLPNSPMNDPDYRVEHGIAARPGEVVVETATFTAADWDHMNQLRGVYLVCDKYAVLRHVATYVRFAVGVPEVAFYEGLLDAANAAPGRWPFLHHISHVAPHLMAPPSSWRLLLDEVRTYVVQELGVPDDDSLDAVLSVQHAVLPSVGRAFPYEVELPHDYSSWFGEVQRAKNDGHYHDWERRVPALGTLPPATFRVDDPGEVCQTKIGGSVDSLSMSLVGWELGSTVARSLMSTANG